MSEFSPELPRSLERILSDGGWHPIMSGLSIRRGEATSFWISELSEDDVFNPKVDHSDAECFLVENFVPMSWARESDDLSASGSAANLESEQPLHLLALQEGAYIRQVLPEPVEIPYIDDAGKTVYLEPLPF
jgi:hypothetical protein